MYELAISLTIKTIERRAKYYRNLIIAVLLVLFCTLVWAIISGRFATLAVCVFLFPLGHGYFLADALLLHSWRKRLLRAWIEQDFNLQLFGRAMSELPQLPQNTLQAMLDSLPAVATTEQYMSIATREAITIAIQSEHANQMENLAIRTIAFILAAGCVSIAAFTGQTRPLFGLFLLLAVWPARIILKCIRHRSVQRQIDALKKDANFDTSSYTAVTGSTHA